MNRSLLLARVALVALLSFAGGCTAESVVDRPAAEKLATPATATRAEAEEEPATEQAADTSGAPSASAPTYGTVDDTPKAGDTIFVDEGGALPPAPPGFAWIATGNVVESFPPQHEYELRPVDVPAELGVQAGETLPAPPAGQRWLLIRIEESWPQTYVFALRSGTTKPSSFATLFERVAAFYGASTITMSHLEKAWNVVAADGMLQGYEKVLLREAYDARQSHFAPDARSAMQEVFSTYGF